MTAQWLMNIYYGFIFFSPAFVGNAAANFVSGLGAIDRGKMFFDGRPILGKNKTIGGLLGSITCAGMLAIAGSQFFPEIYTKDIDKHLINIDYTWYIGFVLGFAAMVGDAVGSFIKRRIDLRPGTSLPIFDQTGFIIASFFSSMIFVDLPWGWAWVIPVTLIIHFVANIIAYLLGWQEVWR